MNRYQRDEDLDSEPPRFRAQSVVMLIAFSVLSSSVATSLIAAKKSDLGKVSRAFIEIRVKRFTLPQVQFRRVKVSTAVNYLDASGVRKQVLDIANSPEQPRAINISKDERFRYDSSLTVSRQDAGQGRTLDVNMSVKFEGLAGDLPDLYEIKDTIPFAELKVNEPVTRAYRMKSGGDPGPGLSSKLVVEYMRKY